MRPIFLIHLLLLWFFSQNIQAQNFEIAPKDTIFSNALIKIQANRNPVRVMELLKTLPSIETCGNDSLMADLYYFYGSAFGQMGQFDSSHFYLDKALSISASAPLPLNQVGSLIAQGNVYWGMEFYHLALEKYQEALVIAEQQEGQEFDTFLVMILGNIGGIYSQLKELDKAFEYVIKSNEVGVQTNNLRPRSHMKIGRYLLDLNKPEQARDSLHRSMKLIISHNDSVALVHCFEYLSQAHLQLNNFDSANYYLQLCTKTGEKLGYFLDDIHLNMGILEFEKGNFSSAKAHYLKGLDLYIKKGKLKGQAEAYELLSQLAKRQNQNELSLSYFELFKALSDSIYIKDRAVRVHELETKFEVKKKEDQIVRLELENELNETQLSEAKWQTLMIGSGALFLLLLGVIFFFFYKKKQRSDQLAQQLQYDALYKRYIDFINGPSSFELTLSISALNERLHNPLTEREYEILQAGLNGMTNQQIADKFFVSLSTVKFHLGNVYNKFGVTNKKEALEYVVKTT